MNGAEIPRTIFDNGWDDLHYKIVFIDRYDGIAPYENRIGRLIEFKAEGVAVFQRKDYSKFEVPIDDIKNLKEFKKKTDDQRGD